MAQRIHQNPIYGLTSHTMNVPEIQIQHADNLGNVVDVHFPEPERAKYLEMLERAKELAGKDFHQADHILNLVGQEVNRIINQK